MRKLKLIALLPVAHIVVSLAIFRWQMFPPIESTAAVRFWLALNGPVLLVLDLAKRLASLPALTSHAPGGSRPFYLIFFIGGIVLWAFVGRFLDQLNRATPQPTERKRVLRVILCLICILCGVRLMFFGLEWLLPAYRGAAWLPLAVLNGSVILLWSCILILVPATVLWRSFSQIAPRHGTKVECP